MDSQESDPPSPLHSSSSSRSRTRGEHTRRTHKTTKDRDKSSLGSTSKELVRLLVHEEQESQELRSLLHSLTERLKDETQRADNAEQRAREVVVRFKEVNDGRLAALQETARVSEELRLYKLQLENAQREILRAQDLLDTVETQRHEAEESAARARTTARKLKEERVVQVARDQGRAEGIREGMERGRILGYEEGRAEGYTRGRAAAAKELGQNDQPTPVGTANLEARNVSSPPSNSLPPRANSSSFPPEETIRVYPPRETTTPPGPPLEQSDVQSLSANNSIRSPQQLPVEYPPDSWIPVIGDDQRIRLPPPHELGPGPFTPRSSPSQIIRHTIPDNVSEEPALMIPPPGDRQETYSENDSLTTPTATRQLRSVRRRKSNDSASTTLSQFDLIGPPSSTSGRGSNVASRTNALSAIVEEKSPSMSPAPFASTATTTPVIPVPITMPTPEAPAPIPLDRGQMLTENYYTRPGSRSSPESTNRNSPSRSQGRQTLSPKSVLSNAGFDINVEPPSRPESGRSGAAIAQDGLLSASDAEHPSQPAVPQTPAAQSAFEQPVPLAGNQLPPGFVPIGAPSQPPRQAQPELIPIPAPHVGDPVNHAPLPIGPQLGIPAIYRLYAPTSATSTPPNLSPEPVVIPPSSSMGARRYSRTALQGESSSESSQDARPVSSAMSSSSMDSLTTPPEKRRVLMTPSYAAAPTPPNVVYPVLPPRSGISHTSPGTRAPIPSSSNGNPQASIAARVPLPQSTIGSPRSDYTRVSRGGGSVAGSLSAAAPGVDHAGRSVQSPPLMVPGGIGR